MPSPSGLTTVNDEGIISVSRIQKTKFLGLTTGDDERIVSVSEYFLVLRCHQQDVRNYR